MPFDQLRRELERKANVTGRNSARDIQHRLRQTGPISSGQMQSATTAKSRPNARGSLIEIKIDTDYAHIVSGGQRPHVITPRRPGGVLVFDVGGRTVFARRVNHPGAQPNDWWTRTIREVPDIIARNWRGA